MPDSLYDFTLSGLTQWVESRGQPGYRARQIFHALYRQKISSPDRMTTLPAQLRSDLSAQFSGSNLSLLEEQKSSDGTVKRLSKLPDGQLFETVLIPAESRQTVCVSTQVGCAYGCAFCASGQAGFKQNLTTGQIVEQLLFWPVTNVVFMGMGEPLANYDNLIQAIRIIHDPEGLRIGARKITVSTVGLVPMIERLSREGLQIELSISLHAPNDELRSKLMPVNRKYPVKELIDAVKAYGKATKRLITFEYILIDQVNDSLETAADLARLLKGFPSKVNLIPCHPTPGTPWQRPPMPRMLAFVRFLRGKEIPCTLRRSRGLDIEGACGQLRLRRLEPGTISGSAGFSLKGSG